MKQSRLEEKAISLRKTKPYTSSRYSKQEGKEYNEDHSDAKQSDGNPLGKGTGVSMGVAPLPGESTNTGISRKYIDTDNGGGSYDIHGKNGVGGRNYLMTMRKYNKENEYGEDSVDTSANILEGQYFVK